MKKLLIISSALIAVSSVSLFANDSNVVSNGYDQATMQDTTPKKKDTTKKRTDSVTYQLQAKK
jgi:hypothetical protein